MNNVVPAPAKRLPRSETGALLQMIASAARDPSVDVPKMRELLQMRKELLEDEAKKAFNEAMRLVQQEIPRVLRNAKGENNKYANLEAIDIATRPTITANGFSESYGTFVSQLPNHYGVNCLVTHNGGHERAYQADVPTDMVGPKGNAVKTAIHGFGSTMSYGRRYLKCLIFNIVLTNEDDDGKRGGRAPMETLSPEQIETLNKMLDFTDSNIEVFLDFAKVERIEEIYAVDYPKIIKALEVKLAKKGKEQ